MSRVKKRVTTNDGMADFFTTEARRNKYLAS